MKLRIPTLPLLPAAAFAALACLPSTHAVFLTGFETSSGYGTNTTVIAVHDTAAPGTNAWTRMFGTSAIDPQMTSSTAHPQTGTQALQFNTNATSAIGASLNLGSSVDVTNPFTLEFSMSIDSVSVGTGNQVQMLFGAASSNAGTVPFWTRVAYDNGTIKILVNNADGTSAVDVSVGSYTDYSALGEYITFSISIDPTTNKYTNVLITGSVSSANVTSTILASASGGTIPHLTGTPGANINFVVGGNDTVNVSFDNLSVVPEPGSAGLLMGGFALCGGTLLRRRYLANRQ